jgi:hypothetical protein
MTSPQSTTSDNLSLLETSRSLLTELKATNQLLAQSLRRQEASHKLLEELTYLLNGFSSGGASFSGYITDPMTQAYLAIVGPALAARLHQQDGDLPELMKGSTLLARELLEELAAYRSERGSLDYLTEQTELLNDPWTKGSANNEPAS